MTTRERYTQAAQDLRAARALLARGWCQRKTVIRYPEQEKFMANPLPPRYCATGAICEVVDLLWRPDNTDAPSVATMSRYNFALSLVHDQLPFHGYTGTRYHTIVDFNDALGRQPAEVLALFDRAITHAERHV